MESGTTPAVTVTEDMVVLVPVHAPLLNRVYVTVPPGWNPPVMVAVSWTASPAVTEVTAVLVESLITVTTTGLAFVTVRVNVVDVELAWVESPPYMPAIDCVPVSTLEGV